MFETLLFLGILAFVIYYNKDKLKALSIPQIIGLIFSLIVVTLVATFFIYVGGNWLKGFVSNEFFSQAIFIAVIIVVISIARMVLNKIYCKITGEKTS